MPKKKTREGEEKKSQETADAVKEESKKIPEQEYEQKILQYAQKGFTAEKIGQKLRDENIHPKQYKKKISQVLKENNQYVQPDVKNVHAKLERIRTHAKKNKQDKRAQRELARMQSHYRKFTLHYNIPA